MLKLLQSKPMDNRQKLGCSRNKTNNNFFELRPIEEAIVIATSISRFLSLILCWAQSNLAPIAQFPAYAVAYSGPFDFSNTLPLSFYK